MSFVGLIGWCAYLAARFRDPLLFVHIESTWYQGAGPHTWFKVAWFQEIYRHPTTLFSSVHLGTVAEVLGLVTWNVSWPAIVVQARLVTIGRHSSRVPGAQSRPATHRRAGIRTGRPAHAVVRDQHPHGPARTP